MDPRGARSGGGGEESGGIVTLCPAQQFIAVLGVGL